MILSFSRCLRVAAATTTMTLALAACSDPESSPQGSGGSSSSSSSSGGEQGGGGSGGADAFDYCAEITARDASCDASEAADCDARGACYDAFLDPADAAQVKQCLASRACDATDDECFSAVQEAHLEDPARKSGSEACLSKLDGCGEGSFPDDYCYDLFLVKSELRITYEGCLDKPCDQVQDCMLAAMPEACAEL